MCLCVYVCVWIHVEIMNLLFTCCWFHVTSYYLKKKDPCFFCKQRNRLSGKKLICLAVFHPCKMRVLTLINGTTPGAGQTMASNKCK